MTYYPLEKLHQLYDGYQRAFRVQGLELLLIQDQQRTYLIENRCPHMDAPLTYASIRDGVIRCPMHGIEFNLDSGQGRAPGCLQPLKSYTPVYEGNTIGIVI
ncbi:Rieske (2Fe-2S) protein [Pseudomaricurvus alkylphenolicus]|jgi:nitrite reductase/ring-hydroxylating ferredoxin subunit|uniref:Rieske (2Fe-2S) protein n=1 Tax=Pseudomaricurvus alkylphenolicus TaxID=1306991 RepID=UPI001420A3E0|nr:Rieske (2Fe-2S) protein [Pseudomaricurvus alkylphenolicus]NIB41194.1 Rieske (2Fe-2S) protein [Pseudomaricurvus alkylphenolicus]